MPETISLLIVDDQQLLREGIRILLNREEDLTVVGEASDGQEAVDVYVKLRPDVVLMDVQMPKFNGVDAIRSIHGKDPQAKVIILTTFDDDEYVFEGMRAGALGYLLKTMSGNELAAAVRTVHQGGALLEPTVARKVMAEFTRKPNTFTDSKLTEPLSRRELEVLGFLAEGLSNRKIASRLNLAEGTIKNYVSSLMGKLNAQDRTQAALRSRELGLV